MIAQIKSFRADLETVCLKIAELRRCAGSFSEFNSVKANPGEVIANLTLAFRHVEDARMRLGKAIQALDGGVSVYKD